MTPNVTEYSWLLPNRTFQSSAIGIGIMDPSFTDNEQKLPLTSMEPNVWMVNNPNILLSFTTDGAT